MRKSIELSERLTPEERVVWRALQQIPNVGPAMGYDLVRLGIRCTDDLVGRKPDELYEELSRLDGSPQDPCVRDVMAAVVEYAETGVSVPWWHFSAQRKRGDQRS
jgi:Pathogenicity locus